MPTPKQDEMALHANPLAIIRELPTTWIPIDQIKTRDDIVDDEIFTNKYVGYLKGKCPIYVTRLALDRIGEHCLSSAAGHVLCALSGRVAQPRLLAADRGNP